MKAIVCPECSSPKFVYVGSDDPRGPAPTWECRKCGWRETYVMRRIRRIKRKLAPLVVSLALIAAGIYWALIPFYRFARPRYEIILASLWCEFVNIVMPALVAFAIIIAFFAGAIWLYESFRNGGLHSICRDTKEIVVHLWHHRKEPDDE
jgi:hypothetical protein